LGNAKDDDNYLDKVIVAATTSNGVFGAKVHWDHFLNLIARAERRPLANPYMAPASLSGHLHALFPDLRYIWLMRRNSVARAISHYRVKKTNQWQLDSRWTTDDAGGDGQPVFDFDEIAAFVQLGEAEDARWRGFFQQHNIFPLELFYEDLVQDLAGAVRRVMGFLGIPIENVNIPAPNLRRQADDLSRDWEARYREICATESGPGTSAPARPILE
jgi:trehalose 2-sulfotransferase